MSRCTNLCAPPPSSFGHCSPSLDELGTAGATPARREVGRHEIRRREVERREPRRREAGNATDALHFGGSRLLEEAVPFLSLPFCVVELLHARRVLQSLPDA